VSWTSWLLRRHRFSRAARAGYLADHIRPASHSGLEVGRATDGWNSRESSRKRARMAAVVADSGGISRRWSMIARTARVVATPVAASESNS